MGMRFLALYLLAGFAGNVLSFIFSAANSWVHRPPFWFIGGGSGLSLSEPAIVRRTARRALNNLILIAVVNFLIGLSPGIDNWGHLGGLLGGLFAWLGGPVLM
jgi:rhomboid protease GluP